MTSLLQWHSLASERLQTKSTPGSSLNAEKLEACNDKIDFIISSLRVSHKGALQRCRAAVEHTGSLLSKPQFHSWSEAEKSSVGQGAVRGNASSSHGRAQQPAASHGVAEGEALPRKASSKNFDEALEAWVAVSHFIHSFLDNARNLNSVGCFQSRIRTITDSFGLKDAEGQSKARRASEEPGLGRISEEDRSGQEGRVRRWSSMGSPPQERSNAALEAAQRSPGDEDRERYTTTEDLLNGASGSQQDPAHPGAPSPPKKLHTIDDRPLITRVESSERRFLSPAAPPPVTRNEVLAHSYPEYRSPSPPQRQPPAPVRQAPQVPSRNSTAEVQRTAENAGAAPSSESEAVTQGYTRWEKAAVS